MRTATALTAALLPVLLWATLASALPAVEHVDEIHAPPGVPADHTGAAVNLNELHAKRFEYEVDAPGSFPSPTRTTDTKMLGVKRTVL